MEYTPFIVVFAAVGAFFMAFNNGANDVANAFASAVGSKAITVKQALFIAAFLNLLGAVLLGSHVALTMINKVMDPSLASDPTQYITGLLACLLASGLFILFSTLTGMPVSSTHAIVGSLTGVVIVLGGFSAVNWPLIGWIALSWLISPFMAGTLSWLSIKIIRIFIYHPSKKRRILKRLKNIVPFFIALTAMILAFSTLKKADISYSWLSQYPKSWTLLTGLFFYAFTRLLLRAWIQNTAKSERGAESIFRRLQVGTSCYVAFAHGSNDVSNSISPALAILMVLGIGGMSTQDGQVTIPLWILLLGGLGMSLGIAFLGHKVMATLGKKITLLTNARGFCVDFSTATTVLVATLLGIPVSSTHAATGSIIGIGLENGKHGVNISILIKILAAWLITVPVAALVTILIYSILRYFFL